VPEPQTHETPPAGENASAANGASVEPQAREQAQQDIVPEKPREVKYMMTQKGFEFVEVDGMRLEPLAKAVRVGSGWGIRLTLRGTVRDDRRHNLLVTQNGPIAFAGVVARGGTSSRFGDKRLGEEDRELSAGTTFEYSRDWPGTSGEKPLKAGESIEMDVGLWGIGESPQSRRPLALLVLRMNVGSKEPTPVLSPPDTAQGG
jgi:hypothetical protein